MLKEMIQEQRSDILRTYLYAKQAASYTKSRMNRINAQNVKHVLGDEIFMDDLRRANAECNTNLELLKAAFERLPVSAKERFISPIAGAKMLSESAFAEIDDLEETISQIIG